MSDPIDNTRPDSDLPCPIVAIGASAGGLEALQALFDAAPVGHGAAYIVVQHLDPDHESLMAELLSRRTEMAVLQAEDGVEPDADTVYLIPPGRSMTIEEGRLRLEDFPVPRGVRRPIDTFFLSLADDVERGFACVVLSGTGSDGSRAFRAVKEAGGLTAVQDPETAKFDGMPRAAVETGFADYVLPPAEIAERINDYFERLPAASTLERDVSEIMPDLCQVMLRTVGHDFSGYKPATLIRRTRRRVQLTGSENPDAYLGRLESDPEECEALFRELLINVTEFFRDDSVFDRLKTEIIPRIVGRSGADEPIRVWVPGCSSGEEPYSLAMMIDGALREKAKRDGRARRPEVQIFATDIDEQMLGMARTARYPIDAIETIPEPYRSRCLIASEGGFTVSPTIRDMVRFSSHSLIKDPPFTRLDLISCRNLLIYLGTELQDRVLPLFHYALKPNGFMVLGTSEGLGRHASLFRTIDARGRVYERAGGTGKMPAVLKRRASDGKQAPDESRNRPTGPFTTPALDTAARRVLDRHAPAYIVTDRAGSVLKTSGRLTKYLEIPRGPQTSDVIGLARPGLRAPLRRLMRRLEAGEASAAIADVEVASELGVQTVDVMAEQLNDGTRLIVIRDVAELREQDEALIEVANLEDGVEDELAQVRFRLRTTVEELEAANEELKSSNEEMMSMNEELQSANEELSTVNDELKLKMDEVAAANADLRNFLESSDIPTIILNSDLEVRVFTPKARELFPLRDGDVGRKLAEFTSPLADERVLEDAAAVRDGAKPIVREVTTKDRQCTYLLQITPYEGTSGGIDGVILSFTDVTQVKMTQADLAAERERLALAMHAAHLGVWEWEIDTGKVTLDASTRAFFGLPPEPAPLTLEDVTDTILPEARPMVDAALGAAVESVGEYQSTFPVRRADGSEITLYGIGRAQAGPHGMTQRMIGINRDVTKENAARERNELMVRELNHRVKNMLTVIASMIRTSGRKADDVDDFVALCETRIAVLSAAHTSLVKSDWEGAPVCDLVHSTLSIFDIKDRVDLDCVAETLPPMESQAISLVLHELATNALKYGALSVPLGRVAVDVVHASEETSGQKRLRLTWREHGGPRVTAPSERGFGTLLLRDMIKHQHKGETVFDWAEEGLVYQLEFDASRELRAEDGAAES